MSHLDWTNSRAGRLRAEDLAPHAGRVDALAKRLALEIDQGKLPWIDMPFWPELQGKIKGLKDRFAGFEHMLLLGIGGSALGPRALQKAFFPEQDLPGHQGPWLWILDNVDAPTLEAFLRRLPPEKTLVTVVSKSGGTIETMAQYLLVRDWLKERVGQGWEKQLLAVTDPAKGFLRQEADAQGLTTLDVPPAMGGRYSVLSPVGLVPAAFLGIDVDAVMAGALSMGTSVSSDSGKAGKILEAHPAWKLAVWARGLMDQGYSQLIFFSYIPRWATFGDWFAQLWAESLGKEGLGSMPLPAVGVTDQHSLQQMFLDGPKDKGCLFLTAPKVQGGPVFAPALPEKWSFLANRPFADLLDAETLGAKMALTMNKVPLVELAVGGEDAFHAGQMMVLCELATLLTGWLLDINPLDQPAVELGKRLANARLGAAGYQEEKEQLAAFLEKTGDAQEF